MLGFDRNENDAEHAVKHAGAGGETGAVEYYFLHTRQQRSPGSQELGKAARREGFVRPHSGAARVRVRGSFESAMVHRHQRAGMAALQDAIEGKPKPAERLRAVPVERLLGKPQSVFAISTPRSAAARFVPNREGVSRLDELRRQNEEWQQEIGDSLYEKLVEARLQLYREIQPQFERLPQEDVNDAVVKLLFRIMFILFAEHTPLLPKDFLAQEVMQRFENDRKWGVPASLYGYVQQYFAWLDGRAQDAVRHLSLRRRAVRSRSDLGRSDAEDRRRPVLPAC